MIWGSRYCMLTFYAAIATYIDVDILPMLEGMKMGFYVVEVTFIHLC